MFSLVLLGILIPLAACGPSPEESAAMTEAVWTDTPEPTASPTATSTSTPTLTPTPIPFDASISVVDGDGVPINGAKVIVGTLEETTDSDGLVDFYDLPDETLNLSVSAQGYFITETSKPIDRGSNELEIVLERDPFGLLPSQGCAEGETLLLLEDFQDQNIQGMSNLAARVDSGAPGVAPIEYPEQPGNYILSSTSLSEGSHDSFGSSDQSYGDAVIRFWTRNNANQHLHVGWHNTENSRYIAFIYADQPGGRIDKFTADTQFNAFQINGSVINDGGWHLIEISTFQGEFQIWIDGIQRGVWADEQALPEGNFFIDQDYWTADASSDYDDISVCELSAPFISLFPEESRLTIR